MAGFKSYRSVVPEEITGILDRFTAQLYPTQKSTDFTDLLEKAQAQEVKSDVYNYQQELKDKSGEINSLEDVHRLEAEIAPKYGYYADASKAYESMEDDALKSSLKEIGQSTEDMSQVREKAQKAYLQSGNVKDALALDKGQLSAADIVMYQALGIPVSALNSPAAIRTYNTIAKEKEKEAEKDAASSDPNAWLKVVPAADKQKISQAEGVTTELTKLAEDFRKLGSDATKFQINKFISGTPENRLYSRMQTLVPAAARLMGEVGNLAESEQGRLIESTLGNITSGTIGAADRISDLAGTASRIVESKKNSYKNMAPKGAGASQSRVQFQPFIQQQSTVPPGMKKVRNKITGEEKLVPQ